MVAGSQLAHVPQNLRLLAAGMLLPFLAIPAAVAQDVDTFEESEFAVSYSYAAIMGTGTYKIQGRRITMLQVPISYNQRPATEERIGLKWYLPLTIGYDQVDDNVLLENFYEKELVTLSAMPGLQAELRMNEVWSLKPFGKIGGTFDFTRDEFITHGVLGLRARATWPLGDRAQFIWGVGYQLAGEYQHEADVSHGFSVLESGVDFRMDTGHRVLDRKVNAGLYYYFQHYAPVWDIAETPIRDSEIEDLHEFGLSVGLKRPRRIFGFTFERLRIGYKNGSGFRGWTVGTDFPI